MDTLEVNKYAGGILSAMLAAAVIGHLGDILVHSEAPAERAVAIATAEPAKDEAAPAEAAEESAIALLASADPSAGEKAVKKCTTCHTLEEGGANRVGPNLWNVVGADKAAVDGFTYSGALADAEGEWTYEALDGFLANPRGYLPGTKMAFAGVKKVGERADLIAFLRTLSASPAPLPEAPAAPEPAAAEQAAAEPAAQPEEQAADAPAPAEAPMQEAAKPEGIAAMLSAADVAAGQKVARKCTACHTLDKGGANRVGPNLWDIVGAEKGRVDGYNYSSAMQAAEGSWGYEELDAYLANPRGYLQGTKMAFAGVKKESQRADLIAFLRTLSDSPQPLP